MKKCRVKARVYLVFRGSVTVRAGADVGISLQSKQQCDIPMLLGLCGKVQPRKLARQCICSLDGCGIYLDEILAASRAPRPVEDLSSYQCSVG